VSLCAKPSLAVLCPCLQPNVEGVRALGIKAIQVEGIAALKAALQREGLYAESDA
jgi:hypothetical protein